MRIMHVITGLTAGGAENQLRLLLRHTRHDAEVVTLTNPGSVAAAIRADGFRVTSMEMRGNRDFSVLKPLTTHIRSYRPDVVHVHLFRSCIYGRIAARLAGVPSVVTTEHSLGEGYIEGRATTRGTRLLYLATERLTDTTVAVSESVRDRLIEWGVSSRKIVVIPNGIDFDTLRFHRDAREAARRELGIPGDAVVVGALGRLNPVKGFDVLLEASRPLLSQGHRLLVVGEGPERSRLMARATACGLGRHVVFTGERTDVPRLLAAMDLLVAPSSSETFGLAVIEGLGAGLPVIYTQCPALDQLSDRGGGKAHRVANDRDELLREMRAAIGSLPGERETPPTVVESFGIRRSSEATDRLYELLATPK